MLTHGYASVDHEAVCETALQDVSKLGRGCLELLRESEYVVKNGPGQKSGADKNFIRLSRLQLIRVTPPPLPPGDGKRCATGLLSCCWASEAQRAMDLLSTWWLLIFLLTLGGRLVD